MIVYVDNLLRIRDFKNPGKNKTYIFRRLHAPKIDQNNATVYTRFYSESIKISKNRLY